jgi:drug/metabolite transporter (DMT)-like permease
VILGAILLGEHLIPTEYAGMAAVVIAVALVTSSRMRVEEKCLELTEAEAVEV